MTDNTTSSLKHLISDPEKVYEALLDSNPIYEHMTIHSPWMDTEVASNVLLFKQNCYEHSHICPPMHMCKGFSRTRKIAELDGVCICSLTAKFPSTVAIQIQT